LLFCICFQAGKVVWAPIPLLLLFFARKFLQDKAMPKPKLKIVADEELSPEYKDGSIFNNRKNKLFTAKIMYFQGWKLSHISKTLGLNVRQLFNIRVNEKWDDITSINRINFALEYRLNLLIVKEKKLPEDYKEIDLLGRQLERTARIEIYGKTGDEVILNPKLENKQIANRRGSRNRGLKNDFSPEQVNRLHEAFMDWQFPYQRQWYEAGLVQRNRMILKGRRIGGTRYFSREAVDDALQTGRSQAWLSASKAQAHEAKRAIIDFVRSTVDIELKGDPIIIPATCCKQRPDEDANLYFLSTNSMTAQGYGANFIFDEFFWVNKFNTLKKVASGMAIHKRFRRTYLSSPSAKSHEAYPFWSGAWWNKGRLKQDHINLDISHGALKDGVLNTDGQWRQIVTVEDAAANGCNLFDIEQLRFEYSKEEFAQLLMCQFIDDGQSVFTFTLMCSCMVDAWDVWSDFKPFANRPLGNREVWVGYDPSNTGDTSALVVVSPPIVKGGKFRILEKQQFQGMNYEEQAEYIRAVTLRYNVTFIGIDKSGIGSAVYQLVSKWYPTVEGYDYSVASKVAMVFKSLSVISKGRLEFDAGWTDMASSFMAIKKTMTASGRQATFEAGRSEENSHSDLAWAVMHALAHEPLESESGSETQGFMVLV
jgi:uncharacterized protein YjcR